jgi:hypothetical protein
MKGLHLSNPVRLDGGKQQIAPTFRLPGGRYRFILGS